MGGHRRLRILGTLTKRRTKAGGEVFDGRVNGLHLTLFPAADRPDTWLLAVDAEYAPPPPPRPNDQRPVSSA